MHKVIPMIVPSHPSRFLPLTDKSAFNSMIRTTLQQQFEDSNQDSFKDFLSTTKA